MPSPKPLELYQLLHRHPEPSGQEERTAATLAALLRDAGLDVRTGVGGHGVVAALVNGPGPVVALRAELDALPVTEETGLPWASERPGVMHACGHDLHLACVVAAAGELAADPGSWSGTVLVLLQPAEETLSGARAMAADGVYDRWRPDVLLAQHLAPFPAGYVAHGAGPLLAGSRTLHVTLHGTGGHAAGGTGTLSPVVTASAIVLRLQALVAGETGPAEPAVVSVGGFDAPAPANVVPESLGLEVSVRAMTTAALDRLEAAVRRIVRAEAEASGYPTAPDVVRTAASDVTASDPATARAVAAAQREALGAGAVIGWVPSMATEDVGVLGAGGADLHGCPDVRLVYWMLGSVATADWAAVEGDAGTRLAAQVPNHSPRFAPDAEVALRTGTEALTAAVRGLAPVTPT
ncbi:amidohydrolase [Nocardioides dongxiaopingii]|uniref:amidohydrolase n=1 Tax=Nocardioides sp. S-1144 TaxID=2582905 RepID=UPI00110E4654|nr:amidohydrolase [Nocardioides sp. S-1144]QCW49588.1 amidohydrolase [Nocardioides sp. S-1144]